MMRKIKWKKEVVTGLLFTILLAGTVILQGDCSVVKAIGETEEESQITEDGIWEYQYVTGTEGETEVTITKYMGTANDPIIPSKINGYPVTELAQTSFNRNTGLTEVELPDSLIRIDGAAFYGCTGLEKITMPDSIQEVGGSAFRECSSLKSVVLSSSLKRLNSSTFSKCSSLKSIWIREGMEEIGYSAFFECTSLETAVIPSSVEDIKFDAFYYCNNITIYAEEGSSGFYYAKNNEIKYITVNSALYPVYKNEDGWLYTKYRDSQDLEIVGYQGDAVTLEIPEQIDGYQTKWIAGRVFQGTQLESLTFPRGVERIGEQVCEGCSSLKSVTLPETLCYLGDRAFWQCTALTEVTIPAAVTDIGMDAFYQCENLSTVKFEKRSSENELQIGIRAFYECDLKSIELPVGVKDLGEYVFL